MKQYFDDLNAGLERAYAVAGEALGLGLDASLEPEIKRAEDLAARVEGIVGPKGIAEGIRSLGAGMDRELIAVELVKQICAGKYFPGSKEELINQAVRTGVAVLTEGVLVAPTEGISKIKIRENPDGSNYLSLYFAGPIRSAGGTAAAQSVVLADLARSLLGIADFRPTESEIERYVEEVQLYDSRAARLQYKPPEDDVRWIIRNCPVCIDGDPTEEFEVSVHKNLERVETNRIRGGICLVSCEGIAQKAAKLLKYTKKIGLNWSWLEKIIKVAKKEGKSEVKPNESFLDDIVAGRPIFAYPSAKGGFRLRYGRTRATGIAAKAIHPATMILLDNFPAIGTQLKLERPGKGCVVSACDSIEGPIVKLENGDVLRVQSVEEALRVKNDVRELLFLGDLLVSFGDFLKSNHLLVPSGYCEEWWEKEFVNACAEKNKQYEVQGELSARKAFEFSRELGVPLHPKYTFFWHDLSLQQFKDLAEWLSSGRLVMEWFDLKSFIVEFSPAKRVLEELGVPHSVKGGDIVFSPDCAYALLSSLSLIKNNKLSMEDFVQKFSEEKTVLEIVNDLSGIKIRAKAPTYIGARMGRPEKAKEREMDSSPEVLFPVGGYGGKTRSLVKAFKSARERSYGGTNLNLEVARMKCSSCGSIGLWHKCEKCGARCHPQFFCSKCGATFDNAGKENCHCGGKLQAFEQRAVDVVSIFEEAASKCGFMPKEFKGVKGMTSRLKAPERLEKGILRAKHSVYVFKDGTCRFDSTNMPLTHFYPAEVGASVEKLRELGYSTDFEGRPLESEGQLVELKPQDIIISENGGDYMLKVSNFVDDLLVYAYNQNPFYNAKTREDLIGQLAITLSPHTSAGILGRIIGYTKAFVGYCHPYTISARRRNCFSGNENIPLFDGRAWRFRKLSEVVEEELKHCARQDDFGNSFAENSKYSTLALNPKTMRFELKRVTAFSKHVAAEHLARLVSRSGRELVVTGEHPLPMLNGRGIEKSMAFQAEHFLVPASIDLPERKTDLFDLLEIGIPDVSVKGDFLKKPYKQKARFLKVNYKTFTDFVYRGSTPLAVLRSLKVKIPENAFLSAKRDSVCIPRRIRVDEDFMFLLGFYIAEGYSRKRAGSHYQVCFTACNKKVKHLVKSKIEKVFKVKPNESDHVLSVCSRVLYHFFAEFLKIGANAHTKSVPSFVFDSPKKLVAAFLSGYFTGDGSVSKSNSIEVNCTSVNKLLIDEISFLLSRFKIKHGVVKSDRLIRSRLILDFYGKPKRLVSFKIRAYGSDAAKFIEEIGFLGEKQEKAARLLACWSNSKRTRQTIGDVFIDPIVRKEYIRSSQKFTYSLTVEESHNLIASNAVCFNCDGDEDCCMLLLDALLNFSRSFLPESRGGTMDAPLILSTIIDPKEVDDEVHAMEVCTSYPLELYEAGLNFASPGEVKIEKVKERLGRMEQYYNLCFTHSASSIQNAPLRTSYVELKSMKEKIDRQFNLCKKIRAVNVRDSAERVILSHFLPDLYGNLRSFSRQTFRCADCNFKYRRVPLAGKCLKCGGKLLLTIHKGGIEKYLELSKHLIDEYELPNYLSQRMLLLEKDIASIFEDEVSKQFNLADFM